MIKLGEMSTFVTVVRSTLSEVGKERNIYAKFLFKFLMNGKTMNKIKNEAGKLREAGERLQAASNLFH